MKSRRRGLLILSVMMALWGIGMRRVDAMRDASSNLILSRQDELNLLKGTVPDDLDLAAQADRAQTDAAFLDSLLPPESATEQTLKDLHQLAVANYLQIATIRRGPAFETSGYVDCPIEFTATGDFNGFYSFLLQIEGLPRLKRITRIQLQSSATSEGDIQASIIVDVFSEVTTPVASATNAGALPGANEKSRSDPRTSERFADLFISPALKQIPLGQLRADPFKGGLAKTEPQPAEANLRRQEDEQRAAALKGVAGLELQSVQLNDTDASCMINGMTCKEGQEIDGFTVETIAPRSVTVSSGIYRFELNLK
jgi:type IV pilus assembly protein PilO